MSSAPPSDIYFHDSDYDYELVPVTSSSSEDSPRQRRHPLEARRGAIKSRSRWSIIGVVGLVLLVVLVVGSLGTLFLIHHRSSVVKANDFVLDAKPTSYGWAAAANGDQTYGWGGGSEWDGIQGFQGSIPSCPSNPTGKKAFVTMLLTDEYITGVLKLQCSLRKVGSRYPLVVVHPKGLSQETLDVLHAHDIETRDVEIIRFRNTFAERFGINWTKLRLWQMTDYSKLVYMDSDMFVVQNIDDLFDLPTRFAIPADTDRQCWRCGPMGFNQAGLFVMEPCEATFEDMMSQALKDAKYRFENSDAEQGFFNYYFQYQRYLLPPAYNFLPHQFENTPLRETAKVLHYTDRKPWMNHRMAYHDVWFRCIVDDVDPVFNEP